MGGASSMGGRVWGGIVTGRASGAHIALHRMASMGGRNLAWRSYGGHDHGITC